MGILSDIFCYVYKCPLHLTPPPLVKVSAHYYSLCAVINNTHFTPKVIFVDYTNSTFKFSYVFII